VTAQGGTLCWFRGLYGDYPRKFFLYFLDLSPDCLVLRKYLLFFERRRIRVKEDLISARVRMPERSQEARRIGSGGLYSSGALLQQAGASVISCTTSLGILEFAVKRTDAPLLLHYISRLQRQGASPPPP
jgi:hypothetical protein